MTFSKAKRVVNESLYHTPIPKGNERIAKIISCQGSNIYSIELSPSIEDPEVKNQETLVILPSKFRNALWVKRGSFVIVDNIPFSQKIQGGQILNVLQPSHIKELKNMNKWTYNDSEESANELDNMSPKSDGEDDLFVNTNRRALSDSDDSSENSD